MGQRVAVMRDGAILQLDTPQQLYRGPTSVFVASFVGSPPMNIVSAGRRSTEDGCSSSSVSTASRCPRRRTKPRREVPLQRCPRVSPRRRGARTCPDDSVITIRAEVVEMLGSDALVHFSLG